jgi:drug/metabolite transporter (DMT)-like permease
VCFSVTSVTSRTSVFSTLDALLLLMAIIWGTNYVIIKSAVAEIDPLAFNALRLSEASLVMLVTMAVVRRLRPRLERTGSDAAHMMASVFHTTAPVTRHDWRYLAALGLVGHCLYQYFFIGGLARTSVANSSLLIATTPVVIALITAAIGHDRIRPLHWAGTLLSVAGIYVVLGHSARLGGESLGGDLMVAAAVVCWAAYTLAARPLMVRHSPVGVTGLSMAIGTVFYLPLAVPALLRLHWSAISVRTWLALMYSALFAICVAYTIWYAAVREIGGARTSVYSNLVPIVAMLSAAVWLGEPLSPSKLTGAAAVLCGVALTRL